MKQMKIFFQTKIYILNSMKRKRKQKKKKQKKFGSVGNFAPCHSQGEVIKKTNKNNLNYKNNQ
jgi:hypothetical protein